MDGSSELLFPFLITYVVHIYLLNLWYIRLNMLNMNMFFIILFLIFPIDEKVSSCSPYKSIRQLFSDWSSRRAHDSHSCRQQLPEWWLMRLCFTVDCLFCSLMFDEDLSDPSVAVFTLSGSVRSVCWQIVCQTSDVCRLGLWSSSLLITLTPNSVVKNSGTTTPFGVCTCCFANVFGVLLILETKSFISDIASQWKKQEKTKRKHNLFPVYPE